MKLSVSIRDLIDFNLDSTLSSRKIDKNLAKFLQSFISPRIIAAAQIGFLLLKDLYLCFQMPVKLINFYIRLQWLPLVLLEWDSNLATSCSVIEKRQFL